MPMDATAGGMVDHSIVDVAEWMKGAASEAMKLRDKGV